MPDPHKAVMKLVEEDEEVWEIEYVRGLETRCEELEQAIVWLCTEMPVGWEEVIAAGAGQYIVDLVKSAHNDGQVEP